MTTRTEPLPTAPAAPESLRSQYSPLIKLGALVILGLLLLIPLTMVGSLMSERLARRNSAVREITSTWGDAQVIFGPVLIVPYRFT